MGLLWACSGIALACSGALALVRRCPAIVLVLRWLWGCSGAAPVCVYCFYTFLMWCFVFFTFEHAFDVLHLCLAIINIRCVFCLSLNCFGLRVGRRLSQYRSTLARTLDLLHLPAKETLADLLHKLAAQLTTGIAKQGRKKTIND